MDPLEVRYASTVCAVLAGVLRRPASEISLHADLEHDLGADSLAFIEVSVALEERFRIVIPPAASPGDLSVRTVADVVALVHRLAGDEFGEARP